METAGTTQLYSFKGREGVGIVPSVTAIWRRRRGMELINAMNETNGGDEYTVMLGIGRRDNSVEGR